MTKMGAQDVGEIVHEFKAKPVRAQEIHQAASE
jgi:hypothetical protein